jgi:pimeloyl-ACP methyl ester carboxylesterase
VCPDLLGFGFSARPELAYTLEQHASAIQGVVRAAEVRQLHAVVGHSCGGVIAMALLATGAVDTRQLVLAGTPLPSPRFPVRQELLKSPFDRLMLAWDWLAQLNHQTLALLWPVLRRLPIPGYLRGARAGLMEHSCTSYMRTVEECLFRADLDPLLPALQAYPTLLLYGRHDRTVPLLHGQRLKAILPQSQLVVLAEGHYAVLWEGLVPITSWLRTGSGMLA